MIRLAHSGAWARFVASPTLTVLPVAAIALGAAAVLSIQLLNTAALASLDASLEAVSPGADLRVEGIVIAPGSVPDEAWPRILRTPGVEAATPIVRVRDVVVSSVASPDPEGADGPTAAPVVVWGLDPVSGSFAAFGWTNDAGPGALAVDAFFAGGIALPRPVADAVGAGLLDPVRLQSRGHTRETIVAGIIDAEAGGTAVMDIAFAQALRGHPGLDRIEVRLRDGADPEEAAAAIASVVPGIRAVDGDALREEGASLFAAFRMNLTALSTVSLLVAAFLVSASVRAALVRRRREIGLYRTLGASKGGIFRVLLIEFGAIALLGAVAGIPLGWLAATTALDRVTATITSFYLLDRIENLPLAPGTVVIAVACALLAALVGAIREIVAASARSPASLVRPGRRMPAASGRLARWGRIAPTAAGCVLLLFAATAVFRPDGSAALLGRGFVAPSALLLGVALLPQTFLELIRRAVGRRGWRKAFSRGMASALAEPQSTGPPAAALTVAVAMLIGVAALVGSFRETLDAWLRQTLAADVYVSGLDVRAASRRSPLTPEVVALVTGTPEAVDAGLLRALPVRMAGRPVQLFGIEPDLPRAAERFAFLGEASGAMAGLTAGGVVISEPLARRLDLAPGDLLELPGSRGPPDRAGPARAPVVAVFRDYGNESGAAYLDRALMAGLYPGGAGPAGDSQGPVHGIALYLAPGADAAGIAAGLAREMPPGVDAVDTSLLRRRALAIFDQTLAVTGVIETLALAIAALGLTLSLGTLARERAAETALLRALGESRFETGAGFVGRGVLIGFLALVLGGSGGALFALLLVRVVNPLWFGWSLELHWPAAALARVTGVVLLVGALAGLAAARRASRTRAATLVAEV